MSVRFVLGKPGTGKSSLCMDEVRERLKRQPNGDPLIYLVPEHMTFSTEHAFAGTPGIGGMTRLNVFSIPRLALRVLQQVGGITRTHLNGVGVSMLLRKIVEQNKGHFRMLRKAADQTGFYDLLGDTIGEFKRYCLSPDQVKAHSQALGSDNADELLLQNKLHDLSIIYRLFQQSMVGKYVDSDDYLQMAAEKLPEDAALKQAEVWVDGFQTMTPEEERVVGGLMGTCRRVTVVLGCDRVYDRQPDEFSAFRHPACLFLQLRKQAADLNVTIEPVVLKRDCLRPKTPALISLNASLGMLPIQPFHNTAGIAVTEAANRREEIERAARQVLALVRDRGYRYREITLLVRDLDTYGDLIATIFADYGIPVFLDRKKPMRHHPLIELIRSALETFGQNWRYEPVFRCVKTGLLIPAGASRQEAREALDRLENYVMACGVYGRKKWIAEKSWVYRVYRGLEEKEHSPAPWELKIEQAINRWRRRIAAPLALFESNLRAAPTVRGKCEAVYRFLIDLQIPLKLQRMAEAAAQKGRLTEAKEHGQVWRSVIDLLDQCVGGAGEERMSLELFSRVIDTGLDQLEFALVPPALDQILVGGMDRMRSVPLRAVFILGVNEGVLPAKPSESGMLSEEDRRLLEESGMHVADGEEGQMASENELILRALTLPEERLYVSYPLASENGELMKASPLIGRLRRLFPTLPVRLAPPEPRLVPESRQIAFVGTPGPTLGFLAAQIRDWRRGYPIADLWWDTYNWFTAAPPRRAAARRVLSSLFSANDEQLNPQTARDLYGDDIQASISRMERFDACPFSQFASYGLNLQERAVFELTAPDIGQLFHLAIKRMTEENMKHHRRWSDLRPEDCDQLAYHAVAQISPGLQRQILTSSGRYRYLERKLEKVMARVARVLRLHEQASGFTPISLEMPFGPGAPIPPLSFTLANGCRMEIVGRIDRVDKAEDDRRRVLLRVIDYKSGARDLSLSDVYYGLALQMLTYLDVVITNSQHWLGVQAEPAGVLYFHVHNPSLILDHKLPAEAAEREIYRHFKMKGLLLEDEDALLMTDERAKGGRSEIAPFGIKKSGGFYKGSSLAAPEEFAALQRYTKEIMKQAGEKITGGDVRIAPYKLNGRIPCTYCPFRPVCQFDRSQPGNDFRLLKKLGDRQVLEQILGKERDRR
ncbi:MAG: helicase-exonuclease AddAB subunit AddB [Sporolactobacillus sp.]|jgi:ATP-dependent helicase/nuclease subunit B|nr:helicase-exonuclease AddAB subunit AddB [Sporolactobacillus sp.]